MDGVLPGTQLAMDGVPALNVVCPAGQGAQASVSLVPPLRVP